jgi:sugar phosphate isomerase/epimerase
MNDAKRSDARRWRLGISYSVDLALPLEQVKEAGIDSIEVTWHRQNLADPEVRRLVDGKIAEARRLGIEMWSVHIPYGRAWDCSTLDETVRERAMGNVVSVLQAAREWGVGRAVFHPSGEPVHAEDRERRLKLCYEAFRVLGQEAADRGVTLAVECLPRNCLGNSASEIAYLLSAHPSLGNCCDVNHLFKETPDAFIRHIGSRIATLHISDNDGLDERHWTPGDGIIRWPDVLAALDQTGYEGVFMYEVRNPEPDKVAANYEQLLASLRE